MQIDIKMESKEKENKNSQEEIEKENGIENPILHNCVGGMKKTIGVTRGLAVAISCPMVSGCKDMNLFLLLQLFLKNPPKTKKHFE